MNSNHTIYIVIIACQIIQTIRDTIEVLNTKKITKRNIFNYLTYTINIISSLLMMQETYFSMYTSFIAIIFNAIYLIYIIKDIKDRKKQYAIK